MDDEKIEEIKLNNEIKRAEYMLSNLIEINDIISNLRTYINNTNKEICELKKDKTLMAYKANKNKPSIKHFIKNIVILVIVFGLMIFNLNINTSKLIDAYKILNNLISISLGAIGALLASNLKEIKEDEEKTYQALLDKVREYDEEINNKKKYLNGLNEEFNYYMNTYPYLNIDISNLNIWLNKANIVLTNMYIEDNIMEDIPQIKHKEIEKYEQRKRTN